MSKQSKRFTFDTPIINKFGNDKSVIAYARISGIGYWDSNYIEDWANQECDLDSIASFDIEDITLKIGDREEPAMLAYRISKKLSDTFEDVIDDATLAHMEYLFSPEYDKHEKAEVEHTDITQ